jgi:hypothetical protein
MSTISWNMDLGFIAAGTNNGILKVMKLETTKEKGASNLTMNQELPGHKGTRITEESYSPLHGTRSTESSLHATKRGSSSYGCCTKIIGSRK